MREYDEWRALGIDEEGDEDPGYWRATIGLAAADARELASAEPTFDAIIIQRRHTTHTEPVAVASHWQQKRDDATNESSDREGENNDA